LHSAAGAGESTPTHLFMDTEVPMSNGVRVLSLAVVGWLLSGTPASAQPTVAELMDQIAALKKQLAAEKARADQQAALAEEARAEALAQRDLALKAEAVARAEAQRARANAEDLERRIKQGDNSPKPSPEIAHATAVLEKAFAQLREEEARLVDIQAKVVPGNPIIKAQEDRVQVIRKMVADAQAQLAAAKKQAGADTPAEVEKLRRELELLQQEAKRAMARAEEAAVAERKMRELAEKNEAERRERIKKLEQEALRAQPERVRSEVERQRIVDLEIERRALLDRVKLLEKIVADQEQQLKGKPPAEGNKFEEPRNKPTADISGVVHKVEGAQIIINIGSDAGLAKGHTLEVFRVGDKPQYVGTVRVVEVRGKDAVVQAVGKFTGPIQVGDRVASQITPD
jgi:hypothetical protein